MSGASLRWPLKPYQLSDDIEAFVHVITFFCLRYHWHDMSSPDLRMLYTNIHDGSLPSERQLIGINGENKDLGSYVAIYYDARSGKGFNGIDIDTGGKKKTAYAKSGTFNWDFWEGLTCGPLIKLVKELSTLLQAQYKELNLLAMDAEFSGRKEFASRPCIANPHAGALPVPEDGPSGVIQRELEGTAPTTDVSVSACKNGALDFHSRIKEIFEEAIDAFKVPEADFKDKTPDQFLGLREFYDAAPRGPSGSRPITATHTASSLPAIETISEDTHQDTQQDTQSPPVQTRPKRKSPNTPVNPRRSKQSRTSEEP